MFTPASVITLTAEERGELERIAQNPRTGQRLARRARLILLAADGVPNSRIAKEVRVSRPTVILQRKRFLRHGVAALLKDEKRPPGRQPIDEALVKRIVDETRSVQPPGAAQWTVRSMAERAGISTAAVHRIWRRHGLQPHRAETFKVSNDPDLVEKVRDVVGLYLNPPDRALVLSVDEKTSIQALDRTQPGLPMKKGRCATLTHDYKRHGTTTLYAALNVLNGKVIGDCVPRVSGEQFVRFLRRINRATPPNLDLHVIVDNSSTHKTEEVRAWLSKHPRFHLHFTPTSGSWLNLVESWFATLTKRRIRRGVFHSVPQLVAAIEEYIRLYNATPTTFEWTRTADEVLAKIDRARRSLSRIVGK